ncbi:MULTISPECIES: hypothetical protein [unclassified Microbulbifer]|uniref:hypothetical protein n=1 Tax=unclassified Microbulbifer TaxID=2619833 RepID=UPI0027E536EC|nr:MULTISPECIES: hypothetical protein [unclassified Microbulbifer]
MLDQQVTHLKTGRLTGKRKQRLLDYLHPEVVNHPDQAYVTTKMHDILGTGTSSARRHLTA